jgi:ABC-type antimicrobial peptide transport system permease subunit
VSNLNIDNVELSSTLRPVPLNGPPSSEDYNDSQQEMLSDLAALTSMINDTLLPLFNGKLPSTASDYGLEGRTLITDSVANAPLTVAQSLQVLQGILDNYQSQLANMGVQIQDLQARFSATNQNDVNYALQSMTGSIETIQQMMTALQTSVTGLQPQSGATAQRTANPTAGLPFFDTTLGKIVWWNGSHWVDATGASV